MTLERGWGGDPTTWTCPKCRRLVLLANRQGHEALCSLTREELLDDLMFLGAGANAEITFETVTPEPALHGDRVSSQSHSSNYIPQYVQPQPGASTSSVSFATKQKTSSPQQPLGVPGRPGGSSGAVKHHLEAGSSDAPVQLRRGKKVKLQA
ncbi:unnamed protein product, partial [Discosporangium mesarthrocarpum]